LEKFAYLNALSVTVLRVGSLSVMLAPSPMIAEDTKPVDLGMTRSSPVAVVTTVAPAAMRLDVSTMCCTMREYTSTPIACVAVLLRVSRVWTWTRPTLPWTSGRSSGHSSGRSE
jgi:hypothetical protein